MDKQHILTKHMLEMIKTLIEASEYLNTVIDNKKYEDFINVSDDMNEVINSIYVNIVKLRRDKNIKANIDLACENASYSLNRIVKFFKSRSKLTRDKIKYELIPILEDLYLQLYFWGTIYPDKEKIEDYHKNDVAKLSASRYIDYAEKKGEYKYDISVLITSYNKLEYTKICLESVLKYMPESINYELILFNHGSTDETMDYFESIAPTKQIDILKNGGSPTAITRAMEGKYCLCISNDIILTKNAVDNMIKCMESDESIGWVVATTPNVSNGQSIYANYSNLDEMHKFAEINNESNSYRWEQRARLCNPIDLKRSSVWFSSNGIGCCGYFVNSNNLSFPDDKVSMAMRRHGYKMMLAKDAYCHHFGSVTLGKEVSDYKSSNDTSYTESFYVDGRNDFLSQFGIDPWGTGFCFDPVLFNNLKCNDKGSIKILGINCGLGSNPLKIKESIKENVHNLDVSIYNITDEKTYIDDLKGVSDDVKYLEDYSNLEEYFINKKFNYIVFESKLSTYSNPLEIVSKLNKIVCDGGVICIKLIDVLLKEKIKENYICTEEAGDWIILK